MFTQEKRIGKIIHMMELEAAIQNGDISILTKMRWINELEEIQGTNRGPYKRN